jgi:hypothetical protein
VADQQIQGFHAFLFKIEAELADSRSRIQNDKTRAASDFDTGRIAAAA